MTIDQVISQVKTWLKHITVLALLALIAGTAVELLPFINIPGFRGIELTQNTGIGMAGLGFLLSKL